jgi:GcrA cell cycle regulator
MPIDSWPDDQVEELKRLHDKGLSSAEAARELNLKFRTTHSRNAVIGKKARLGLSVPTGPRTPRMKSAQDRVLKARIVRPRPAPHQFACDETGLRIADVVPLDISIDDLTDDTCRWPYGERPVVYCGHQPLEGLPYCASHTALATRPWQDRRDAGKTFPQSAVTSIIPARKVA